MGREFQAFGLFFVRWGWGHWGLELGLFGGCRTEPSLHVNVSFMQT